MSLTHAFLFFKLFKNVCAYNMTEKCVTYLIIKIKFRSKAMKIFFGDGNPI